MKIFPRRSQNWLQSWIEFTNVLPSPEIFRKWAGISILSSALERRVWVRTKGADLFPNLYIILVGPPGVGKSAVLSPVERVLRGIPDIHVAPNSVSAASLVDSLALAKRSLVPPAAPEFTQFHYLTVVASELGVFLPQYDPLFMNFMQKIYDGETYEERRRTGKVNHTRLENAQLSLVGGTTPSYLNQFLPDGAWDQGFTARTIFVYSGETPPVDIFGEESQFNSAERAYLDLIADLKSIVGLFGKMAWTPEAAAAIQSWASAGLPPVPEHGKLVHYNSRRLVHVLKLCIVAAISRSSELLIQVEDYQQALDWLIEAETFMPDIFHSVGVSGEGKAMEDLWGFLFQAYAKEKKPIAKHRLVNFLKDRVPSHSVLRIIDVMVHAHIIALDMANGYEGYVPRRKA